MCLSRIDGIVHFLPVFGCLGDYARGHGIVFFVLTKTFQPREWSRACVCGVAPETTPKAEKSRFDNKDNPKIEV
jgi:hypothetical protein